MRIFLRIFFLGLLICLTVTACGTKGPLYLPEKKYPQEPKKEPEQKPEQESN